MASTSAMTPSGPQENAILARVHNLCPSLTLLPEFCSTDEMLAKVQSSTIGSSLLNAHNERDVDLSPLGDLACQLAQLHTATSARAIDKASHTQIATEFGVTSTSEAAEQAMFVQPYETKSIPDANPRASQLAANAQLLEEVGRLRQHMRTSNECVIHGNLTTDAVVLKDGKPKVINWHTCRMGPAGYDLGVMVAHLFLAYYQHMLTPEDNDSQRTVMYAAMNACNDIGRNYMSIVLPSVAESERECIEAKTMSDAAGYAGCELLRCVVSAESTPEFRARPSAIPEVMQTGIRLINSAHRIDSMGRLLMIGLMLC